MEVSFPSARHSLFIDAPGEGWGTRHESEIDGVTFSTIVRIHLTFADGSTLTIATRRAPATLRRQFGYLHHVRFFTAWFAGSRGIPSRVCGLDVHGRVGPCFRYDASGPRIWIRTR